MSSDYEPRIGDFVFWDRSDFPETVWQVNELPNPRPSHGCGIWFVAGFIPNKRYRDRSAFKGTLTPIPPLQLLALLARTDEEWSEAFEAHVRLLWPLC